MSRMIRFQKIKIKIKERTMKAREMRKENNGVKNCCKFFLYPLRVTASIFYKFGNISIYANCIY